MQNRVLKLLKSDFTIYILGSQLYLASTFSTEYLKKDNKNNQEMLNVMLSITMVQHFK